MESKDQQVIAAQIEKLIILKRTLEDYPLQIEKKEIELNKYWNPTHEVDWEEALSIKEKQWDVKVMKRELESFKNELEDIVNQVASLIPTLGVSIKINIPNSSSKYSIRLVEVQSGRVQLTLFLDKKDLYTSENIYLLKSFNCLFEHVRTSMKE